VQDGGFYGWPWYYMGEPRTHAQGKHPELKDKVITPDVILQPHFRIAGNHILRRQAVSREYDFDAFAAQHALVEPRKAYWI